MAAMTRKTMAEECLMSPRPTSGATMAPKTYPPSPSMADAAPAFVRPSFMAKVLPTVNIMPIEKIIGRSAASYAQKSFMKKSAPAYTAVASIMTHPPAHAAFLSTLKRSANMAPAAVKRALKPMNRPNFNCENPYISCMMNGAEEV